MNKSELRRQINSTYIGFDPDRMKAAHIANGLFMEILGAYYPTDLLNRLAVVQKKNLKDPSFRKHDTTYLLEELKDKLPPKTTIEQMNKLRYHLNQHVDADDGVYDHDDSTGCAYSGATALLVTRDRENDGFSGNFIGILLMHNFGQGESPIVSKIQRALKESNDPISSLATVLTPDYETPISEIKSYASKNKEYFHEIIKKYPILAELRQGFDRLGYYYPGSLSAQRFLRLVVILAGITLIRYLMLLYENYNAQHLLLNNKLALLIDSQQMTSTRVRFSSQATYSRVINSLTSLYGIWLSDWVKNETELNNQAPIDRESIIKTYERIIKNSRGNDRKLIFPGNAELPDNLRNIELTPNDVLKYAGEHMASNMLRRKSEDDFLSGFIREVGMRCGLIKPRSSRQPRKHIDPQADTLEVLVMACLDPMLDRKGIRIENFAEQLWEKYGLLFGAMDFGLKDFELLSAIGIDNANPDDLKTNCEIFTKRLSALGLARTYADGYSIVQCPQYLI